MRYSLRAMMVATLAVAIASSIIAPLLRMFDLDAEFMWHMFGGAGLGALLSVGFRCWRRYKIEHQCGPLELLVPMRLAKSRKWIVLQALAGFGLIASDGAIQAIFWRPQAPAAAPQFTRPRPFNMASFWGGCILADAFLMIWWKGIPQSTELCQNGVVMGSQRLMPWSDFRGYRWIYNGNVQLVQKFSTLDMSVPLELRSDVDEVLRRHLECLSS